MSDLFERVTGDQDFFKKILGKIPGFKGYVERQNRRSADKLLRDTVADHFEVLWQRVSSIQRDLVNQGALEALDDVEAAAIKLRTFIDRVRRASYGYAGLFDAIKVNEDELASIYVYDAALLDLEDEVSRGIDNLESSIGTDGLPAAIRNLIALAQKCIDTFDKRSEVIQAGQEASTSSTTPAQP